MSLLWILDSVSSNLNVITTNARPLFLLHILLNHFYYKHVQMTKDIINMYLFAHLQMVRIFFWQPLSMLCRVQVVTQCRWSRQTPCHLFPKTIFCTNWSQTLKEWQSCDWEGLSGGWGIKNCEISIKKKRQKTPLVQPAPTGGVSSVAACYRIP